MKPPPKPASISVADMVPHHRYKIVFNRIRVRELFEPWPSLRWIRDETPMAIRVDADLRPMIQ